MNIRILGRGNGFKACRSIADGVGTLVKPRKGTAGAETALEHSHSAISEMERLALEKANKTVSAIENAVAVWEASPVKPEDLKERITRLRYFYEDISRWEKKTLQTLGREDRMDARIERLKEFVEICRKHSK